MEALLCSKRQESHMKYWLSPNFKRFYEKKQEANHSKIRFLLITYR